MIIDTDKLRKTLDLLEALAKNEVAPEPHHVTILPIQKVTQASLPFTPPVEKAKAVRHDRPDVFKTPSGGILHPMLNPTLVGKFPLKDRDFRYITQDEMISFLDKYNFRTYESFTAYDVYQWFPNVKTLRKSIATTLRNIAVLGYIAKVNKLRNKVICYRMTKGLAWENTN
jgi:hypothetical protein